MTALVPVLIGVQASRSLGAALTSGYRPTMIVLAGLCVVAAVISAVFVRDGRTAPSRFAPPAPVHGCSLPDTCIDDQVLATTSRTSEAS